MKTTILLTACVAAWSLPAAQAQSVNLWRGDESGADWGDPYKWKLKHPPRDAEAAHFRHPHSVVNINQTVQLNNGLHLYGKELFLKGNGNVNLWNPVPHQRTVSIPASASGYANLTVGENLSLNGRVALSAKAFGTSASKGSITLKDRATVTGALAIGNAGCGTGQVFVRDQATYRITRLELATRAETGGSAQIHILGGTVHLETEENPLDVFLSDTSRQIILGDMGTLHIETHLPFARKKEMIKTLIRKNRLVAAPGCRLVPPVLHDNMLIARAEDERTESEIRTTGDLLAAIDRIRPPARFAPQEQEPARTLESEFESLVQNIRGDNSAQDAVGPAAADGETGEGSSGRLAGYIVFLGSFLLVLRRPKHEE